MIELVLSKSISIEGWIEKLTNRTLNGIENFDDWLDGNWIVFIIVILMFCYEFYTNFDKWMVL